MIFDAEFEMILNEKNGGVRFSIVVCLFGELVTGYSVQRVDTENMAVSVGAINSSLDADLQFSYISLFCTDK